MFGTSGIRGTVGETVTASLGRDLGCAIAAWGASRCVIGRDPRPSGRYLARAVESGLMECGVDVIDVGMAATPTVARSVAWCDAAAGVVVTASHNPPTDNGFKLWHRSGQAFRQDDQAVIESHLTGDAPMPESRWTDVGSRTRWPLASERHLDVLVDAVEVAAPLNVVVDIGNGVGQVTARALDSLGCHVTTLNGQPDGRFPGRPSEPSQEHCEDLRRVVPAIGADLGIAHDGDADRMRAVDETGAFPTGDELLALFAVQEVNEGDRIAAPVDTSLAVADALESRGASLSRTRVGDVYVAERTRADDVVFGGEPSGAWIWPAESRCPDGPLAACKLVELVAREGPLSSLLDAIETYPLCRTAIPVEDKTTVMRGIREALEAAYDDIDTLDGIRVDVSDGWLLIRPSGTESIIRITAEAREASRAEALLEEGQDLVNAQSSAG